MNNNQRDKHTPQATTLILIWLIYLLGVFAGYAWHYTATKPDTKPTPYYDSWSPKSQQPQTIKEP